MKLMMALLLSFVPPLASANSCEELISTEAYRVARVRIADARFARPHWMKVFRLKTPSAGIGFAFLDYVAVRGGRTDVATALREVSSALGVAEVSVYQGFVGLRRHDAVMTTRGGSHYDVILTPDGLTKLDGFVHERASAPEFGR